nr:UvrD-helicase domain-containing protein [Microvirga zambiensis]
MVSQALAEAGYGICPVPYDGVLLRGDDAQLHRAFSQVLVRDDVGEDEQALLAAHELGHLVLHRPEECCELATSGVGSGSRALSRVETYGPRERRELQANVFAREFILPREQARRLFLDEKLPASEIARRIGMPLPEVRRQILEALLKPDDAPPLPASAPTPIKLDPSQQKAVDFNGRALLVEAGPGSGKTRTLVARIERRLGDGVPPSKILALTFSNKAAAELSGRIAERRPDEAAEVWTGTFHAFGLEVMRLHYDRMGLTPNIRLISPSQAVEMLEERLPLLGLTHFHDLRNPGSKLKEILKPIGRAKDELIAPPRFRELAEQGLAEAMGRRAAAANKKEQTAADKAVIAAEKTLEAATVYEVYEHMLQEVGCVDFADLVMRATLLIENDEEVRRSFWQRYREILVDEYQDVNRACARLLKALHGPETTLWVVGDSRQSIYRFRGASSLNMDWFTRDFEGATTTPLEWNYRSSEHIVGLCRTFAKAMDGRQAKGGEAVAARSPYCAQARRGEVGSRTVLHVGLDDPCEADLVAKEIRALEAMGVPLGHQTILARTNARLDALATQLAARGIPTLHLGSFFEREEVRDLLSILALVAEPNGAALVRISALREVDVHSSDIALVLMHARERNLALAEVLPDAGSVPGLSSHGAASLARLGRRLAGLTPRTPAFAVAATWLLEQSDYLRDLSEQDGIEGDLSRAALWQLIEFLDQTEPDGRPLSGKEILRRVRTVILMADDRDLREPGLGGDVEAVRLMTVHAAKGLEFPAVHIVGLHEKNFPSQYKTAICQHPAGIDDGRDPKEAQAEEEDCAMFVAISRAEDHLRLYHTEKAAKQAREPSRFLSDLGVTLGERLDATSLATPAVGAMPEPIDVGVLSLHDLNDFDGCRLKIAYRHRMAIRSRRYEGPFLQASGVVYEILDRVSEIAASGVTVRDAVQAALDEVWQDRGPVGHSLETKYRELVQTTLGDLAKLIDGFDGLPERTIKVPIDGGHVVAPVPLISSGAGPRTARFIELRSVKPKELRAGILHAAAVIALEQRAAVEVAQLTDGAIVPVVRSADEAAADLARAAEILAVIRSGALPPRPEMHTCMKCAHFFSCPATGARRAR